jgi:hypothetical protein
MMIYVNYVKGVTCATYVRGVTYAFLVKRKVMCLQKNTRHN